MTPQTINISDLPEPWKELRYLLVNMKKCRESEDTKGLGMYAKRLMKWKDNHPEEAIAFAEHIAYEMTTSQEPE